MYHQLDVLFWLTGASFYLGGGLTLLLWAQWRIIEFVCRRLKPTAELLRAGRFPAQQHMAQGLESGREFSTRSRKRLLGKG
jgi:hypothetical protein